MSGPTSHRELLLLTVRAALGTATPEALPVAVDDRVARRWLALARAAGVVPLVHAAVTRAGRPRLPAAVRTALTADAARCLDAHTRLVRALMPVLARFAERGVPVAVLKGAALLGTAYTDPALRPMRDVDLLVSRENRHAAADILVAAGWESPLTFARDATRRVKAMFLPRVGPRAAPILDLHWSLVDERAGAAAGIWAAGAEARLVPGTLAGAPVLRLTPTDTLVHVCLHLAVHHGLCGLRGYCDIAALAGRCASQIAWDALAADVRRARLVGIVGTVLRASRALACADIPDAVLAALTPALRPRAVAGRLLLRSPRMLGRLAVHGVPGQDYVLPLLLADRGRDVARLVSGRLWAR